MKKALLLVIIIASLAVAGLWLQYDDSINRSHITESMGSVVVTIKKGQHLNQISLTLEQQGVVVNPWFKWLVRIEGAASKIQAGEYQFSPGLTPKEVLAFLIKGQVNQYAISIIEGQSFKELLTSIQRNSAIKSTLPSQTNMLTYIKLLGIDETHLEGTLLPETYFFIKGTSDVDIIKRAHQAMQVFIRDEWPKRNKKDVIKSQYDALILASIVEKETAVGSERPRIAGLFLRRLEIGMKLQTDPTVIYGMGDNYKGDIRFRDLRKDTPYNTYTRYGLPPTPIAMPGKASILAVLHPEKTQSLYFVSKGNGTHIFSNTLKQHNAAVDKYQRNKK
ncbi:MAG: aminodeoxychorismate lyase [Cycloclasticus sp.]|nr:MAG: aminodeoxychorismate lyase [Cycloclasticus sp.]